jgi:hypothetical protein
VQIAQWGNTVQARQKIFKMAFSGFDFWEGSGLEIKDVTDILEHSGNR